MVEQAVWDWFGVPSGQVLGPRPDGVLERLGGAEEVVVDPLFQYEAGYLRVAAPERDTDPGSGHGKLKVLKVPIDDPSWLWNSQTTGPSHADSTLAEYQVSNNFGQQQGMACAWPATHLAAMTPAEADNTVRTARKDCPHHRGPQHPEVATGKPWPSCNLNDVQCAAKGASQPGPGGPRVLVPYSPSNTNGLIVPPGLELLMLDANPTAAPLPVWRDMATIAGFGIDRRGRISASRLSELVGPNHRSALLDAS